MAKLKFTPDGYQDLGAYALLKNVVENGNLVTEGSGVTSITGGTDISITGTAENPIINYTGGGGGGEAYLEVTKAEFDTLVSESKLKIGKHYKINSVDTALYGGTVIIVKAISPNEIEKDAVGIFYNPNYSFSPPYGVAKDYKWWANEPDRLDAGVYNIGDKVIWGGLVWTCIQETTTTTWYVVDAYNLDLAYFATVAYNGLDYNTVYDKIKYDYLTDTIYERDEEANIVSSSPEVIADIYANFGLPNPIKAFQWGNKYNPTDFIRFYGITGARVYNSYLECINFQGSQITYCNLNDLSFVYNMTLSSNYNGSMLYHLTMSNQATLNNIYVENYNAESYQGVVQHVEIKNISTVANISLNAGSTFSFVTVDSSTINDVSVTFSDISRVYLENSGISNLIIINPETTRNQQMFGNIKMIGSFLNTIELPHRYNRMVNLSFVSSVIENLVFSDTIPSQIRNCGLLGTLLNFDNITVPIFIQECHFNNVKNMSGINGSAITIPDLSTATILSNTASKNVIKLPNNTPKIIWFDNTATQQISDIDD